MALFMRPDLSNALWSCYPTVQMYGFVIIYMLITEGSLQGGCWRKIIISL